ncbi:MAG: hypothetical protein IJ662_02585 [Clostridia bacterium]|nr:hypothetical protein [Clostridia bacterium]
MKRIACLLCLIALLTAPFSALGEDWARHDVACKENRLGCRLLQMVMMGSFDAFSEDDWLTLRVLSAAYPQLCAVEEADFIHFMAEFGIDDKTLRARYYAALGNCLWADILTESTASGRLSAAQRVLLLFLNPAGEEDAAYQMAAIRADMTDELLSLLAAESGAPEGYVRFLIDTASAE